MVQQIVCLCIEPRVQIFLMLASVTALERSKAGGPIVGAMRIGVEHLTALSRGCAHFPLRPQI